MSGPLTGRGRAAAIRFLFQSRRTDLRSFTAALDHRDNQPHSCVDGLGRDFPDSPDSSRAGCDLGDDARKIPRMFLVGIDSERSWWSVVMVSSAELVGQRAAAATAAFDIR